MCAGWLAVAAAGSQAAATGTLEPCPVTRTDHLLEGGLPRLDRKWRAGVPIRMVALGSSSTAGAGASTPQGSYPSQLELALRRRWPGREFVVINAGVNGQDARDMLDRLERDVLSHKPDLVLWQFGSNGVMRGVPSETMEAAARTGIARIHAAQADVVLIDLQHAPRIDEVQTRDQVLGMMRRVAQDAGAALFHRYRLMLAWDERLGSDYPRMLLEDRLHLNDFSYRCMAGAMAEALEKAMGRTEKGSRLR